MQLKRLAHFCSLCSPPALGGCGRVEACPLDCALSLYEPLIRLARSLTPRHHVYLLCRSQAPYTSSLSTVSTAIWSTTCTRTGRASSTRSQRRATKKSWTFLESTPRTRAAGGIRHPQNISCFLLRPLSFFGETHIWSSDIIPPVLSW